MEHFPPKRILVPYDFTGGSRTALVFARELGALWGASLDLVHVVDFIPPAFAENNASLNVQETLQSYYRGLEDRMREAAAGFPRFAARLEDGVPRDVLTRRAAQGADDLIVMGTHGRTGMPHFFLGSVAEATVRASKVPVLTVHADAKSASARRILAPVNFTDYSDDAVLYAAGWARSLGAKLSVLHVVEPDHASAAASGMLESHVRRLLQRDPSGELETILDQGEAAERILATAEALAFDFIVLAARRKPFWKSLRLGTTAERVVRYARIPVVSVPTTQAEAGETDSEKLERLIFEALPR